MLVRRQFDGPANLRSLNPIQSHECHFAVEEPQVRRRLELRLNACDAQAGRRPLLTAAFADCGCKVVGNISRLVIYLPVAAKQPDAQDLVDFAN
jgi:hypothetical protein